MYCVDSSLNDSDKWITFQVWHGFQSCLFAYVHIYTYIYKSLCVHVCACICTCVCVCVQIHIDIDVEYIKISLALFLVSRSRYWRVLLTWVEAPTCIRNCRNRALFEMIHYHLEVGKHGATLCVHRPAFALILASSGALISLYGMKRSLFMVRGNFLPIDKKLIAFIYIYFFFLCVYSGILYPQHPDNQQL